MKTLLKDNSRFNLRKDEGEEEEEKEGEETTEDDETTKALNEAVVKELVAVLGKQASEGEEEEEEEEEDLEGEEEEEEEEETEKSLKDLPKSTRTMLRKMQKDLKIAKKEITRLRKNQDPASLVIGKDANMTLGQLAEFVGRAVVKAQEHIEIPSGKVPKKKEGETDDEFKKRTESESEEVSEVGEMVTSLEELSKLSDEEVTAKIEKGLVPETLLKEALGDERYAIAKKQGLADRLVAITK